MTNNIIRNARCESCKAEWPIYEYSPSTYGDQGEHRVLKGGFKITLCTRCWNQNVHTNIFFGENGWEWRQTELTLDQKIEAFRARTSNEKLFPTRPA